MKANIFFLTVLGLLFCIQHVHADELELTPAHIAMLSIPHEPRTYCPWRDVYKPRTEGCPFCTLIEDTNDQQNFILGRFKYHVVTLNLYPYTKGHVLILPNKHIKRITDLNSEEQHELIELIGITTKILEDTLHCAGVNVGINFEQAAGASVPNHMHIHILPRYLGDRAFIQMLGGLQVTSDLPMYYNKLKPAFEEFIPGQQETAQSPAS